ncbi:MAG: hypothetical protein AB1482_04865 [Pseudomonadota bacterium]
MQKQIVVLANSVKHDPGRCIAGREINSQDGAPGFGPWVRPVSKIGEGELYPQHFVLQDDSLPQPFDVIEVYVDAPGADTTQPENWFIAEDKRTWNRVGKLDIKTAIRSLVENPQNLWIQPGVKTDRVTKEFLASNPPQQSLYLLDLRNATITANVRKYRIRFSFKCLNYDLAITDPLISRIVGEQQVLTVSKGLVCISLAPAFVNQYDGIAYHYKLAAMVIPYE